jgi:hypothetical protein
MLFKKYALIPVNLKLFDEAGGAAGGTGGTGEAGAGAPAGSQTGGQSTASGNKGDKPVVVYGKQPTETQTKADTTGQAASVQKTPEQLAQERTQNYQKFKTDFKDLFDGEVQNIINRRFRDTKTMETNIAAMNPIIDILAERYGTDDLTVLMTKLKADSIESLAEAAGLTVEQYEQNMRIRAENRQLKASQSSADAEAKLNAQVAKWYEESTALIGTPEKPGPYPTFNLKTEIQNDQFLSLLKSGVSVKAAYEVVHMSEILANTAVAVAKQTETGVIDNIKARGNRPEENAAKGSSQGVLIKADVSKLTKEDRAEIARRAARGENIQV